MLIWGGIPRLIVDSTWNATIEYTPRLIVSIIVVCPLI